MTKTHEIKLDGYGAHTTLAEDRPIMLLGTAESYGIEMLHVVSGKSWEGLTVTATFNAPDGTSTDVLLSADGSITVPPEATGKSGSGKIVFTGVSNGIQRISCDLEYFVVAHSAINGVQSGGTAPSWFEQAVTRFMPTGGTAGQVLTKVTDADFDAEWQDSQGGAGGITPTIGDNGNWYLGTTDTGKPSRGEKGDTGANGPQGPKGDTGATGADGKSAYSYAVDGGYTGTEQEFAAKLAAEKLPNPYPLTFTGAVSETYDGSSAKTIEIPSGGGGAFTASYTVAEEVTSYTLNIDTSKYLGYVIFVRNSTKKAPSIIINREHKRLVFNGYDANTNFFDINIVHNDSDDLLQGCCRIQKNNNISAAYYSYVDSNKASGITEENNGIIITAETIGAGSEIFVRCI